MRSMTCWLVLLAGLSGLGGEEGDGLGGLLTPAIATQRVTVEGRIERALPVDVEGQEATFASTTSRSGARLQVWRSLDQELQLTASAAVADLQTTAELPESGPLPERLYDLRGGFAWRRLAGERRIQGLGAALGSASDRLFADGDDLSVNATAFATLPSGAEASWMLSLSYSTRNALFGAVPFPGVMYLWKPTPTLRAMAGLPVSGVMCTPSPRLDGELLVTGFGSARAGLSVAPVARLGALRVRGALAWGGDSFARQGQDDDEERILLRAVQASLGLRHGPRPGTSLELSAAYAFARRVIEGESVFDDDDRIELGNGAVFGLAAALRF